MRVLLDTHVLLWPLTDDRRLPERAREIIADTDNFVHVSAACLWEIAIKHGLGKGSMPVAPRAALTWCLEVGYRTLAITAAHAIAVHALPALHRDPFDRFMIAQAQCEPMRLITHDAQVARYDPSIVLV